MPDVYLDYGGPPKLMASAGPGFPLRTFRPGIPVDCSDKEAKALCAKYDGKRQGFGKARLFVSKEGPAAPPKPEPPVQIHPPPSSAPPAPPHEVLADKRKGGRRATLTTADVPIREK